MAEGVDPLSIIDICHKGLVEVGKRYEQGVLFISGLIMAGERSCARQVSSFFRSRKARSQTAIQEASCLERLKGIFIFIGKGYLKVLVRGYGFAVHDLGV